MCACGHVCVCTHMHEGATHSWGKNPQGGLEKAAFPRETRTPEAHAAPPKNTEALACRKCEWRNEKTFGVLLQQG